MDDQTNHRPSPGCPIHAPCTDSYCSLHGQCEDSWNTKSCTCLPGYKGDRCQVQAMATFNNNQFLHFGGNEAVKDLGFSFSTVKPNGILAYTVS